ncbi:MAG: hypothetical protein ETSY1_46825 (plasmid) [Candidatus Entotheonella factor]|uniref:Helicase C-terminal domain-containing protein n=1 Tax=Entotheonella factor TaxID=1429438 RepID=W4LZR5_ENTF1|nr:MAG: hypothetical protein ETSY1_46825 [Candidatus Entotheonella factor]
MANPAPRKEYLVPQRPSWVHLPTKAVRVPECFASQLLVMARAWDDGQDQPEPVASEAMLIEQLEGLSLEQLLELQDQLDGIIKAKREATRDRRLEQAILYLADRCDGAAEQDGAGFNKFDARFGHWLAQTLEAGWPLSRHFAEAGLRMVHKYRQQLEIGGLSVPEWPAIAHQYADAAPRGAGADAPAAERRIELAGDRIAVYSPYDKTGGFQRTARSIEDYAFEKHPKPHWHWPIRRLLPILAAFPERDGYVIDPALEGVSLQLEAEQAEVRAAKEAQAHQQARELLDLIEAAQLDAPLPNGWTLYDHQRSGVEWLLAHRQGGIYRGGILADHMGLGKTLEALVAAKALQRTRDCRVFVVCPASLRSVWAQEAANVEVSIEIFSWAKLPKPLDHAPYLLIGDEAHYIQDSRSKRTQGFLELAQAQTCVAVWALTGTPLKNGRPINLYPLLAACDHPLSHDRLHYHKHYCAGYNRPLGRKGSVWDVSGAAHLDELAAETGDVILRRTKADCLDLPPKIRQRKPAELEAKASRAYHQDIAKRVADYRRRAQDGEVDPDAEALVTLNILRQVGSRYKVSAAVELAESLLEQGEAVVIFTEFVDSARQLHEALGGELLTGETPAEERQPMVERFQSGASRVWVSTIRAGGVGLTLTAASHVLLVDRPWTPGDAEQAEDRCHRIGQVHTVSAFWLQLGLIDEAIDQLLEHKSERIELVLKGKRKTLRGVSTPQELAKALLAML